MTAGAPSGKCDFFVRSNLCNNIAQTQERTRKKGTKIPEAPQLGMLIQVLVRPIKIIVHSVVHILYF